MPETMPQGITFLGSKTIGNTFPEITDFANQTFDQLYNPAKNPVTKGLEDLREEILGVRKDPLTGNDASSPTEYESYTDPVTGITTTRPKPKGAFAIAEQEMKDRQREAQALFNKYDDINSKIRNIKNKMNKTGVYTYKIDNVPASDLGYRIQQAITINDVNVANDGLSGNLYGILIVGNDETIGAIKGLLGIQ